MYKLIKSLEYESANPDPEVVGANPRPATSTSIMDPSAAGPTGMIPANPMSPTRTESANHKSEGELV
jgi:hypothetical protein